MWGDFINWAEAVSWGIAFGTAVGWNFPQPPWAAWAQAKLVAGYQWAKAKLTD